MIDDKRENRTYGEPMPLHSQQAVYDGYRSVRLLHDDIGLATTAYSYKLGYDEVQEAAERIALMWNLHLGESLEELRRRPLPPTNKMSPSEVITKIAQVAAAVGWQANEPAMEMAGQIVSVLATNPEHIDRFLAEGSELFIDGTLNPENGSLTYRAMNGEILSPSVLREKKGQQQ